MSNKQIRDIKNFLVDLRVKEIQDCIIYGEDKDEDDMYLELEESFNYYKSLKQKILIVLQDSLCNVESFFEDMSKDIKSRIYRKNAFGKSVNSKLVLKYKVLQLSLSLSDIGFQSDEPELFKRQHLPFNGQTNDIEMLLSFVKALDMANTFDYSRSFHKDQNTLFDTLIKDSPSPTFVLFSKAEQHVLFEDDEQRKIIADILDQDYRGNGTLSLQKIIIDSKGKGLFSILNQYLLYDGGMKALCSIWDLNTGTKEYFDSLDAVSYQDILERMPQFIDFCDNPANGKVDMLWCVTEVSCSKQLHRLFTDGILFEIEEPVQMKKQKKAIAQTHVQSSSRKGPREVQDSGSQGKHKAQGKSDVYHSKQEDIDDDELSEEYSDEDLSAEDDDESDDDSVFSRAEKLFKFADKHITGDKAVITRTMDMVENGARTAKRGMNVVNRIKGLYNTFSGIVGKEPQLSSPYDAQNIQQDTQQDNHQEDTEAEDSSGEGGLGDLLSTFAGAFSDSKQDSNSSSSLAGKVKTGMKVFKTLQKLF